MRDNSHGEGDGRRGKEAGNGRHAAMSLRCGGREGRRKRPNLQAAFMKLLSSQTPFRALDIRILFSA